MNPSTLAASLIAALYLSFTIPVLAAQQSDPATAGKPSPDTNAASKIETSEECLRDLRAFHSEMQEDGYWLGGSGYGYGYPIYGYGYDYDYDYDFDLGGTSASESTDYGRGRPGFEIRTLIAAANIFARSGGEQQVCEALLIATRDIYTGYVADMRESGMKQTDMRGWRHQQIAAAQPVSSNNAFYRSDQLIGTDVVNLEGEALGRIDDIIHRPQTGKIAYLVVSRGGMFGIGEKYVPVPWEVFKASTNLMVLDTTKSSMDAAPQVQEDQFSPNGNFDQQSAKVEDYWKSILSK